MAGDYREWEFVVVESPQAFYVQLKRQEPGTQSSEHGRVDVMLLQ